METKRVAKILKFDLADEIMAEHRKVIAAKRKSPGEKSPTANCKQPVESSCTGLENSVSQPLQAKNIVTMIVAGDIEKLCQSCNLNKL